MAARKKAAEAPAKPGNLYVIAGTDEGMVRDDAHRTFQELAGEGADEFGAETVEGTADNSEHAFQICRRTVEALQTLPFFGRKVVWLKGADFFADTVTGRSERTLEGVELLHGVLETGLSPGIVFLLSAGAIDKRRSFWKLLEKRAEVRVHDKIDTSRDGWQEMVAAVVERRAEELGYSFEGEALELFVMLAGEATQQISNELEKLDLYLGERRLVTVDDVRKLVPLSRAGVAFEIGNAIQQGDITRALELVDHQLEHGENPVGLMRASMIPTVRHMFLAAAVMHGRRVNTSSYPAFAAAIDNLPEEERAWLPVKKGGGVNAYPLFLATRGIAKRLSAGQLRNLLEECARADRDLVSTGVDPRLILQRLITGLAPSSRRSEAKQHANR